MSEEDSEEISRVFEKRKLPSILWREEIIDRLRAQYSEGKTHREVPESSALAPER